MVGDNVLSVGVNNWATGLPDGVSPLGLDLQGVVTMVPEPSAAALLLLGMLGLRTRPRRT